MLHALAVAISAALAAGSGLFVADTLASRSDAIVRALRGEAR